MRGPTLAIASAAGLIAMSTAVAIDRDAKMIDTIGVVVTPLHSSEALSGFIWGETTADTLDQDWAFIIGGTFGSLSPDLFDSGDFWSVGLGMKYYVRDNTSVSLLGTYGEYDLDGSPSVRTGELTVRHRLVSAFKPISPFVLGSIGLMDAEAVRPAGGMNVISRNSISADTMLSAGAGCDFAMGENWVLVFQALYTVWDEDTLDDRWVASLGMSYYWP